MRSCRRQPGRRRNRSASVAHARVDPVPPRPRRSRGKATATTAARGMPAIAAMSERLTPIALYPTATAPSSFEPEVAAVHQHVGRHEQLASPGWVAGWRSRRQCLAWSKGCVRTCSRRRIQSIRANSPDGASVIDPSSVLRFHLSRRQERSDGLLGRLFQKLAGGGDGVVKADRTAGQIEK